MNSLFLTVASLTSLSIRIMNRVLTKKQTYVLSPKKVIYLLFLTTDPFLLDSEDRVIERFVFKHLYNHLRDNNILSSLQLQSRFIFPVTLP